MSANHATTPTLAKLRQARFQQQAFERGLRIIGAPILLIFAVSSGFEARPHATLAGPGLAVSIGLAGFVLGLLGGRSAIRRRGGLQIAFVLILVASSVTLMCVQPNGPGSVGVFIAVLFVARWLPERFGMPLVLGALVVLAAIAEITGQGTSPVLLIVLGAFIGMMFLTSRLGEANAQAEAILVELEQTRAAEARAARLAERQRLAREMHDVLAHSLSGLMLQLEGARMLAAETPDDPRLPQIIERAHHLGNAGLEEARRAIGMLRDDELPGPELIAGLAAQFQADRDVPCRFTVSGEARELGPEASLAVYRVAQEALTNVAKHAHPERVEMSLRYEALSTRLTIEDFIANGAEPDPPGDGGYSDGGYSDGGYGLTGMSERADLLGGKLTAVTTASGFRVELDVPV